MASTDPPRLALVTGTTSGIGLAVARHLLDRGWTVAGIARRAAQVDHPRYHHVSTDLTELAEAVHVVEGMIGPLLSGATWKRIGLVNNAASADLLTSFEQIDPRKLLRVLAVNTAAPVWLMGFVIRRSTEETVVRIVNVSSGAAVGVFPGLAAYSASKVGLRMAGMVAAAELASSDRRLPAPTDVAVLSYEPGIVDTPMQTFARGHSPEQFPWVQLFWSFAAEGRLVAPEAPAGEIVDFLEGDGLRGFTERRFGGPPRDRDDDVKEKTMADINECVPGRRVRVLQTGVARVVSKTGTIVEVTRTRRPATGPLIDRITVDVPGHGEVVLNPADIEILRE